MFQHGLKIQADILQPSIFKLFDGARRNSVKKLADVSGSYYPLSAGATVLACLQQTKFAE